MVKLRVIPVFSEERVATGDEGDLKETKSRRTKVRSVNLERQSPTRYARGLDDGSKEVCSRRSEIGGGEDARVGGSIAGEKKTRRGRNGQFHQSRKETRA